MRPRPCCAAELVLPRDMRIALYTPSDHPDPATAWGGPALVHLLARALDVAGHQAFAPSEFRSDEGHEEGRRQAALERKAAKHATRLVATYRDLPTVARPDAWLTCHLQHAAPDLIGPVVAETLAIPYLLVGASYARAEAGGAHAGGLSYAARAIARARAVLSLTAEDEESIRPLVPSAARLYRLAPFLDPAPYRAADRDAARRALAAALPLDPARPWLLAVAPMRPGAALASWRLLGRSLGLIADPPWQLLAVGEGEARTLVEEALEPLGPGRAVFAGAWADETLPAVYAACDVYVWPAYREALSMAVLAAGGRRSPGGSPGLARRRRSRRRSRDRAAHAAQRRCGLRRRGGRALDERREAAGDGRGSGGARARPPRSGNRRATLQHALDAALAET